MQITFLGTGTSQGVPVITCKCPVCQSQDSRDRRLRTSALITTDDNLNFLIDIGPDFREQMLRQQVMHLDGILITHAHRDHVAGIDDIRAFNYTQNCKMQVYANKTALDILQRDYHYIFDYHEFPGLPEADLHCLSGDEPFSIGKHSIMPIKAMHKTMPVLGYRIGNLAYITDANFISDEELRKLQGLDVLAINSLRQTKHFSHYSLPEALEIIKMVNPREAYITHMSHEMGLHDEVEKILPSNVHLAYDGLKVNIVNKNNTL